MTQEWLANQRQQAIMTELESQKIIHTINHANFQYVCHGILFYCICYEILPLLPVMLPIVNVTLYSMQLLFFILIG